MKPVKLFYLRSCPFCKKALRYIDEARAAHPELAAVGIEMIEESEQPEVASHWRELHRATNASASRLKSVASFCGCRRRANF